MLSIFFRAFRGEDLFVRQLADEFGTSVKTITRDINDIKSFFADSRELVGNSDLAYSHQSKAYQLRVDGFLSSKELFALLEIILGTRAFSKFEILEIVNKLKRFASIEDRALLEEHIRNELYHYKEVWRDCDSVQDVLWQLAHCIRSRKEITVDYYHADRSLDTLRLCPASVMFADHYFYLIAFPVGAGPEKPQYFRVDRIRRIIVHRKNVAPQEYPSFNEGELRRRSLFMFPGKLRTIRFEFNGPSVQAALDKLPTSQIIERRDDGTYLLEAEVYGDGIRMWLLSQGSWVKVVSPDEFVAEMRAEIAKMAARYE